MTTVFHVSDLHFGRSAVPAQIEAIEQLIQQQAHDVVAISGDLSQRARAGEFQRAAVFIRDVTGTCREGRNGELLAGIEAAGIPTFCGAGFEDAVKVVKSLDLDRPIEAAKAVVEAAKTP